MTPLFSGTLLLHDRMEGGGRLPASVTPGENTEKLRNPSSGRERQEQRTKYIVISGGQSNISFYVFFKYTFCDVT